METGSLVNLVLSNSTNPIPKVGDGCTILGWSDRHAATIIEVTKNGKCIKIQQDTATRTDKNGMSDSQSYTYAPNPKGSVSFYTIRKNGRWVEVGGSLKSGGRLSVGHREEYYDFGF